MWFFKLVLAIAVACIPVIVVMCATQTQMLFPARLASTGEPHLPASAARLEVETRDGERLQGVHIAPARTSSGDRLVILGFGGNAWNAETLAVYLHELFPDTDAGAFHYRGYWPSTRLPSATVFGGKPDIAPPIPGWFRSIWQCKRMSAKPCQLPPITKSTRRALNAD